MKDTPETPFVEKGLAELKKFLLTLVRSADECEIHHYRDENLGFRISEVDFVALRGDGMSGSSFMRSVPECGGFILACEDFIAAHETKPWRPEGWESDIDDFADVKWRLKQLLKTEQDAPQKWGTF